MSLPWLVLRCIEGRLWITQEHDLNDYVLKGGDAFVITQAGSVVIEAMCDARLQVFPSLESGCFAGDNRHAVFS